MKTNFTINLKYIISLFSILIISSCVSSKSGLVNEKSIHKSPIKSDEEKSFFHKNIIPKERVGFYNLFFSYIEGDYSEFLSSSELFMKDDKNPQVLKFWVSLKQLNLFKKDIISFDELSKFFLKNSHLDFISVLNKEAEVLYKQYFMLKKSKFKKANFLNKWSIDGPYRMSSKKSLTDLKFDRKYDSVFVKNKVIDFKNSGIVIPSDTYNIYGGIYKLKTNIHVNDNEINLNFMNVKAPFILMIDDKIVFSNDSLFAKRNRDIVKLKLKKGSHKLTMILVNLSNELFIYANKDIKLETNETESVKGEIKVSSLYDNLIKDLYNTKEYSHSFKSIIAADISIDFLSNTDFFYKYISQIEEENFYKDYLTYSFYNNFSAVGKVVRNKNMQKFIKMSIKKNPNFYKSKMEYIVLLNKPNPYEVLTDLENIKPTLWYYKLLAEYYKKANLIKKYLNTIHKIYNMKNGETFVYKYFIKDLSLYDYPLYTEVYRKFEAISLYKVQYSKQDMDYILNEIKNAPYSRTSLDLLLELKNNDENIKNNPVLKNFMNQALYTKVDESPKDFKDLLNKKNSKNFIKGDLFLKKWSEYIKFDDTKNLIQKFKTISEKESFPTTKLLDYDIAFIEKDYWILVNRRIIKINNSQGLRRYSSLNRNDNYLKLMTVSNADLKEYEPYFGENTSEISLEKLKVGDFIELITYQFGEIKPESSLDRIVSFRYKDFNQTVVDAKLDLYIDEYHNQNNDRKLFINSKNGFDLSNIKNKKVKNYILHQYHEKNLKGVKREPYSLKSPESLFPSVVIGAKLSWKSVYRDIQLFMDYLDASFFSKDIIESYKSVKTLSDLKKLYYTLIKDITHANQYFSYFDSIYLNKRGNLAYFMKMILAQNNIDSEVLIFHSKYNFTDKENIPSLSYFNVFVLKVELDKKTYYLDFSNKWSKFNVLPSYLYKQAYLRVDKDKNIFKEKFKKYKKLETKTNVDVDLTEDGLAKLKLKIEIPASLSAGLKSYLAMQSKEKINMVFNSLFAKKFGFISEFKVSLQGQDDVREALVILIAFTQSNFGQKQANKFLISGFLNKEFSTPIYNYATLKDYAVLPIRTLPLLLHYFNDTYTLNINFPKNYKANLIKNIYEKNDYASYNVVSSSKNNTLKVVRKYFIDINKVEPSNYNKIKSISERVIQFKQQDITADLKK